ncbi:MAG: hypothetical protein HUJ76_06820 [Parasporobacterium sp.]|nr:hypothetical protein [Parasporobacterium sp.]
MRTGTGKKPNYKRTTGSRTARLYSKKTARKISRMYEDRNGRYVKREPYRDSYDYYDDPAYTRKRKNGNRGVTAAVIILVVAALVMIILGLVAVRPREEDSLMIQVSAAPVTETETETAPEETSYTPGESNAPVIYGIMPLVTYQGHPVAYKSGVFVEDDNDSEPTLTIENDGVDLTTPGTYTVTYVARDKDLNETRETTILTVLAGQDIISDEDIYAAADKVLDAIITEDMTDPEKCLKVYEYLHCIGYVDQIYSEDWMQNAYWMLRNRQGDCFCYYSAARLLLSRLGYDVLEVRNNNNYVHYWAMVSIDRGNTWWHFDACCWSWGEDGIVCLVSDSYLEAFTRRHMTNDGRLIHAWDKTNYPATPVEDFWTDADRSVIYLNGIIDFNPVYDQDSDIWNRDGWGYYYDPYYYDPYYYDYYYDPYYYDTETDIQETDPIAPDPGYVDPGVDPGYVEPPAPDPGYVEPPAPDPGYFDPGYPGDL